MSIHVQLERFEGPLGLLLHLIREQEMDIFNINIHHITRQYLEYIKAMRRLDLEVAGEFVAMAATLLHIKSRMLLPQYNEEGEEVQEDPRKELVQKLLEYKKFQELSGELYKRPLLGRDVFLRGEREAIEAAEEGELILEENPLFSLIAAYRTAVRNMKKTVHKVTSELQSIASRILEIRDFLRVGQRLVFGQLITDRSPGSNQVLITFLSLLELAKMGFISVFQTEPQADIYVEAKRTIDRDVVSQVENYESVNADETANKIMSEAQLSLAEPEPMLEGEEAPVVEAAFTDAATDEDIEAEERRLFAGEDNLGSESAPVAAPAPETVSEAVEEVSAEARVDAVVMTESSEEVSVGEQLSALSAELSEDLSATEQSIEPESIEAAPTETDTETASDSGADTGADTDTGAANRSIEFSPQMIQQMPTEFVGEENDSERNVNSAVSAALSAFDAFNEEAKPQEEKPQDERPPEVES